ncbi:MAG: hypothetical protein IPG29_00590 [Sphingobacteriales bacterium]|nr:hypothetical protein [Sphingobacteriales bacterium]
MNNEQIWEEYKSGKQTYLQLAHKYNCSVKTIQRRLDKVKIVPTEKTGSAVVVLMDTTYWGRGFGVMLFKDAYTKENLLKYYVKTETNALYMEGIEELKRRGFTIAAIVCDGRKGLIQSFKGIPVQMCQFHQAAIIRRYLTRKPKLKPAQELMDVVDLMKQTDKESFVGALGLWFEKWRAFLNERTLNPTTNKSFYTHKRLRSAYRSLKNNLPCLFTWHDNRELQIPNTTNAIDGHFADLKNKLRNHNGLSMKRKMKFIDGFLRYKGFLKISKAYNIQ